MGIIYCNMIYTLKLRCIHLFKKRKELIRKKLKHTHTHTRARAYPHSLTVINCSSLKITT